MENREIFRKNLNYLMKRDKVQIKDLAKMLKINPKTVGAYKEGRSYPPAPVFAQICKIFQIADTSTFFEQDMKKGLKKPSDTIPEIQKEKLRKIKNLLQELL